jgi:hypothetical protein
LTLRRLRSRFGISAPRVAVRTQVPWYWRALGAVLIIAAALAMAGWIYDAGRRFAGFDATETGQELRDLREKVGRLEAELDRQIHIADAGESSLQIERTAQQQLTLQVKRLEQENARLKEDLGAFEGLAQGDGPARQGLAIQRLRVEASGGGDGHYRYRMLVVVQGAKQDREFTGSLQLVATVQQEGKLVMITFPRPDAPDTSDFAFNFKHFRRLEGVFRVPAGAVVKAVEARVLQGGATVASQRFAL